MFFVYALIYVVQIKMFTVCFLNVYIYAYGNIYIYIYMIIYVRIYNYVYKCHLYILIVTHTLFHRTPISS